MQDIDYCNLKKFLILNFLFLIIEKMLKYYCSLLLLCFAISAESQSIKMLHSGNRISLRGLSVVDDNTVWVSGNNGTVGKSVDGGANWAWMKVKGFDSTDFRDIEAFDDKTAIIMGISEPAYILKTTDGGANWKTVYENKTKGMFLDAMDFADELHGIIVGDPINNEFFIGSTNDGGNTWTNRPIRTTPLIRDQRQVPYELMGKYDFMSDSAEACFASSGTNIRLKADGSSLLVSGGNSSRLFAGSQKIKLPLLQGKQSTGANSVAINKKKIIVVGGDFTTKDSTNGNCCYSTNAGKTWKIATSAPHGYRSCVEYLSEKKWISCGLNGVDISNDNGDTWTWISKDSFNACRKAKKGTAVFFAGGNGRIGRLNMN